VRAELRGFYSSDIADLETYRPDDGENFAIVITAFAGPAGGGGEEMFFFTVCTAAWLRDHPPPKGFEFLRGTILLTRWDYNTVERALSDLCLRTQGEDWPAIALRLSRYGRWEHEDSTPHPQVKGGGRSWWRRVT
jgi:hypothetical protein